MGNKEKGGRYGGSMAVTAVSREERFRRDIENLRDMGVLSPANKERLKQLEDDERAADDALLQAVEGAFSGLSGPAQDAFMEYRDQYEVPGKQVAVEAGKAVAKPIKKEVEKRVELLSPEQTEVVPAVQQERMETDAITVGSR